MQLTKICYFSALEQLHAYRQPYQLSVGVKSTAVSIHVLSTATGTSTIQSSLLFHAQNTFTLGCTFESAKITICHCSYSTIYRLASSICPVLARSVLCYTVGEGGKYYVVLAAVYFSASNGRECIVNRHLFATACVDDDYTATTTTTQLCTIIIFLLPKSCCCCSLVLT